VKAELAFLEKQMEIEPKQTSSTSKDIIEEENKKPTIPQISAQSMEEEKKEVKPKKPTKQLSPAVKKEFQRVLQKLEMDKERQTLFHKDGKFLQLIPEYKKNYDELDKVGLDITEEHEEFSEYIRKKAAILNNINFCYMQTDETKYVVDYCSRVIDMEPYLINIDPDILIKAYVRRGISNNLNLMIFFSSCI